ncbi:MAG TPA: glycosyltransferase, partial [Candidatus Acidoferrales bacterium]|nr:glycosyltransferase [Candidatus Acidoferrales bacterium]
MLRAFLFLLIIALTGTGGDVTLTRAMKKVGEVHRFTPRALLGVAWRAIRVPQLWIGIAFLTAAFFSFLALLSWQPVSFVLPASALGYVVGAFAAKFILRERVDPARWIGVVLVCIGVVFVWAGDDSTQMTAAALLRYTRLAFLVFAAVPLAYFAFAIATAERFFTRAHAEAKVHSDFTPPISILKPIRGLDREPYENFASFCRQDYPQYEILFAAEPGDPAIPVIQRLIEDFPDCDIRIVESSLRLGENNKVCKLAELARAAKYDILAESDSDVRVGPEYLRQLAAKFRDPKVGGVTALYRGYSTRGIVSALDCLGQSVALCGSVLVAQSLEGLHFMMGSTMAVTRASLVEIGGFESLADLHSDDYELGDRIVQKGHRLELLPEAVW